MAPKLPTAQQIARERIKHMPTGTLEQGMARATAFMVETQKAKAELARGEWTEVASDPP